MDPRNDSIHSRQGITITPPPFDYHHHLHTENHPIPSNRIPNTAYAFNSLSTPFDSALLSHQHQHQNESHSGAAPDAEQSGRRRRGRPRKYSPDAGSHVVSVPAGGDSGSVKNEIGGDVNGEGSQGRRLRGRPPGSGKKQLDALGVFKALIFIVFCMWNSLIKFI